MQYYQHMSKALMFHSSKNYGQAQYHISKALEIQDGEIVPMSLLANIMLQKGSYKEAQKLYQQIEEYSYGDEAVTGSIGNIVCQLYMYEKTPQKANTPLYRTIETKLKVLSSENPDSPDLYICHGQLFLLQAKFFKKNNDIDKFTGFMERAERKFEKAQTKFVEYPPSLMSCKSLFMGLAELNYIWGNYLLEKTPSPKTNSSQAAEIYKRFTKSLDYYRTMFLYRDIAYPSALVNSGYAIDRMLSFPWLTAKQQQQVMSKAEHIMYEINAYSKHIRTEFRGGDQIKKDLKMKEVRGYIEHGIGIAKIYMGKPFEAKFHQAKAVLVPKSSVNEVYAQTLYIASLAEKNQRLRSTDVDNILQPYLKSIQRGIQKKKFTSFHTKFIANFFYVCHVTSYKRPGLSMIAQVQKIIKLLPDEPVVIDGKRLSYLRILKNNMYHVAQGFSQAKDVKKYRSAVIK